MAKVGRPLKFESVEELEKKINEYFDKTPKTEITITGLALALDTSRETLCNYEKKDEYFDTIKKAKDKVQLEYELDLRRKGRSGDIFALKNFGWKDKIEQKIDADVKTYDWGNYGEDNNIQSETVDEETSRREGEMESNSSS